MSYCNCSLGSLSNLSRAKETLPNSGARTARAAFLWSCDKERNDNGEGGATHVVRSELSQVTASHACIIWISLGTYSKASLILHPLLQVYC